jgi:hypothetical protein
MKSKFKWITVITLVFVMLAGMTGCSSNAECKVTVDRDGNLDIIVNPPGETGDAKQNGSLERNTSITSSAGSMSKVITYNGEIEKNYTESGNAYKIKVINITIEDERLTAYQLSITGGVYGETSHTCAIP